MNIPRLTDGLRTAAITTSIALVGATGTAAAPAHTRSCAQFSFHDRVSPSLVYRVTAIVRSPSASCHTVRKLIVGTYTDGAARTVYPRNAQGQPYGRPTLYFRGGWRCSTGAGGMACWNAFHRRLDVIPTGAARRMAITAVVTAG